MISKQAIVQAVRTISKRQQRPRSPQTINPVRDWFIILTAVFVLGTLIVIWSTVQFMELQEGQRVIAEPVTTVPTFNTGALDSIQADQATRAMLRDTITSSNDDTSVTGTTTTVTTGTSTVRIQDVFPEKIVYDSSAPQNTEEVMRAHCRAEGGTFNTCGSVCPATAEVCTEQCAFTCELTTTVEQPPAAGTAEPLLEFN